MIRKAAVNCFTEPLSLIRRIPFVSISRFIKWHSNTYHLKCSETKSKVENRGVKFRPYFYRNNEISKEEFSFSCTSMRFIWKCHSTENTTAQFIRIHLICGAYLNHQSHFTQFENAIPRVHGSEPNKFIYIGRKEGRRL